MSTSTTSLNLLVFFCAKGPFVGKNKIKRLKKQMAKGQSEPNLKM